MPSTTFTRASGETHTISGTSDEELYIELRKEASDRLATCASGGKVEGEGHIEFDDLVPAGPVLAESGAEVGRRLFFAPANGRTFAATARPLTAFSADVSRREVFGVRLFAGEVA